MCLSRFSNIFSSETANQIEAKCHVEPRWHWRTNVCANSSEHMANMVAMPIYGKTLKIFFSGRNQKVDDLRTWYAVSSTRVIEAKCHVEPRWHERTNVCANSSVHMANMVAMPIFCKTLKIFFSGTKRSMTLKLDMQYQVLE